VTTDAVLTGAWRLPAEKKSVLLFVNVGDEPLAATLEFDGRTYGAEGEEVEVTRITAEGPGGAGSKFTAPRAFERELEFPPRRAWAWEVR
jgi:hypothetical protein